MLPLIIGAVGVYLLLAQKNNEDQSASTSASSSFNPQLVSMTQPDKTTVHPALSVEPTATKQVGGMGIYHF